MHAHLFLRPFPCHEKQAARSQGWQHRVVTRFVLFGILARREIYNNFDIDRFFVYFYDKQYEAIPTLHQNTKERSSR